ncbi:MULTISPECIES: ribose 5-phosphate isomerase B [Myxococcus]|uniref:Ribose 5-phosphate isomerase B n=2 Tax=Myxococcus TaxID=32 RepID=L7UC94_MYXSD|nr:MULTISPECIES: ribose 5-phosphate isomerase B [Myxococcus]AGC46506.1 ribose 5-phosphate isomerase B [Myxococcus stipitatus DSM 14675]QSQ14614.1 ribose 5-phosphate isomerase B [Myxococcus landrumus]
MKVILASDHAGLELRQELVAVLRERNVAHEDVGPFAKDSVDYPDFAARVTRAVVSGEATLGVLVCGTGIGMSIVANKYQGIRAALCTTEFEARMSRAHNDANVLCLGQRVVGAGVGRAILEAFLDTAFSGGRHERRVQMIREVESQR